MNKILNTLAKALMKEYPRSPHETLGGYVIAARMLDKCRALVNGTLGEYRFDCPLDNFFLSFTSISSTSIMRHIESGANDEDVAGWITDHSDHSEDTIKLVIFLSFIIERAFAAETFSPMYIGFLVIKVVILVFFE